jgi:hypothetical protein
MPVHDYSPRSGGITDAKRAVDPNRCKAAVTTYLGRWPTYKQCSHKPKANGYCGTHDPVKVAAREQASDEAGMKRFNNEVFKSVYGSAGARMAKALEEIGAGHNDPRALAREVLEAAQWEKYKDYRS